MRQDPLAYFIDLYHEHGPIFNIRLVNRNITVIAGLEANQFLADVGDEVFSSEELFGGFAHEMQTDIFLVAMDGPPHKYLRKIMHHGYSRSALVPHMPKMMQIIREFSAGWGSGEDFAVFPSFQRLVTEQLGWVMAHRRTGEDFDHIRMFLRTMLFVRVLKFYPRFLLWNPAYLRAKSRVFRLAQEVLDFHRQNPPDENGRPPDAVDDILAACDENGQPFSEDMMRAAALGPFLLQLLCLPQPLRSTVITRFPATMGCPTPAIFTYHGSPRFLGSSFLARCPQPPRGAR
jgi:cytochrome P450